jgi:hypothetical protein
MPWNTSVDVLIKIAGNTKARINTINDEAKIADIIAKLLLPGYSPGKSGTPYM